AIESTNDSLDVAEVGSGREQEQVKQLEQEVIAEDRSLARIDEQREAQSSSSEPVGVLPPAKKSASEQKFDDPNCARAGEEAERARKAPSEADKLFYFRRAIRLCPSNPAYHVEIAAVYQGIGRPEDAEVELKEAVELDPQNADAKSALAAIEAMAHEEIN
ncbi:MAG: hypothetical protein KDD44_09210, partial [Bdellovibrionales bacterium]|nr:hypothetical protein [Bdellovibrionales bacterium]